MNSRRFQGMDIWAKMRDTQPNYFCDDYIQRCKDNFECQAVLNELKHSCDARNRLKSEKLTIGFSYLFWNLPATITYGYS